MKKLIIAIDGPIGSGKSSVARRVAELLGYVHLDSGAMYRALGLKALRRGTALESPAELEALAANTRVDLRTLNGQPVVLLDGEDITAQIRTPEVAQAASKLAVVRAVRRLLVAEQRRAAQGGGAVMEGRDIGSVVFPDAELKIYLDASPEVRAQRRLAEYQARGEPIDLPQMIQHVRERDQRDRERAASPLVRVADAVMVDTTAMEVEEAARLIVMLARARENEELGMKN